MAARQKHMLATVLALMVHLSTSLVCGDSKAEEDSVCLVQLLQLRMERGQHTHWKTLELAEADVAAYKAASENPGHVQAAQNNHAILVTPYMVRKLVQALVVILAGIALYLLAVWQWRRGHSKEQDAMAVSKSEAKVEKPTAGKSGGNINAKAQSFTHSLLAKVGLHRCLTGVVKIMNVRSHLQENSKTPSAQPDDPDAESRLLASPCPAYISPAEVCLEGNHPNFSGTWKCVEVEGDPDSLMGDMGMAYYERSLATAVGYGAGRAIRIYSHKGAHVKMTETGLCNREQEYDISGEEQKMNDYLVKPYWDTALPCVMVIESMDAQKEKRNTWSTTRQYFIDKDTLALDVSSPSGCTARWVWQRDTAASKFLGDEATDTTILGDAAHDVVEDVAESSQQ